MADSQSSVYEPLRRDEDAEELELTDYPSDIPAETEASSTASSHHQSTSEDAESTNVPEGHGYPTSFEGTSVNVPKLPRRSALQKIGKWTVVILSFTLVLTIAIFGFLAFLWAAPHDNNIWHTIVAKGWANRAVTASALLLRTAVDFQAGTAAAMLAAILLETDNRILLVDTAQVSKLRAGRAMPLDMMMPFYNALPLEWSRTSSHHTQLLVLPLLTTTTILLQFTSTVLVSDLSLGILPGMPSNTIRNFDIMQHPKNATYNYDVTSLWSSYRTWFANPRAFPTFGEFSEPIETPDHVDDTGHLLRALLPFQDARTRETLKEYSGKAVVIDSRVSCQRPRLQNVRGFYVGNYVKTLQTEYYMVNGTFSNTEHVLGLLGSNSTSDFQCRLGHDGGYVIGICQIGRIGSDALLHSDLWDIKLADNTTLKAYDWYGPKINAAHLVFNVTINSTSPNNASQDSSLDSTNSGHGAWTDLEVPIVTEQGQSWEIMDASVSLCYPALWNARLDVELRSSQNRTEPVALSSKNGWYHTDPDVQVQMGGSARERAMTVEARNILALSPKDSWLPDQADAVFDPNDFQNSFILNLLNLVRTDPSYDQAQEGSAAWKVTDQRDWGQYALDPTLVSIFTASLRNTNGSAATALSILITILAFGVYYDQMPNFEETANVTTISFEPFLFPRSFHGFTAVVVITILHCLLVLFVIVSFVTTTRLTTIGDHWQSIAQVVSPATEHFLTKSTSATDKEIAEQLKTAHREKEVASIQELRDGEARVGLFSQVGHRRRYRSD